MYSLPSDHSLHPLADRKTPVLHRRFSSLPGAFTLAEMLAVLAIIGILTAIVLPSLQSLAGQSFSGSVSNISTLLEQARAYAMAYNTYVYVGLYEADAGQSQGVRPQAAGTGRVYVAVAQYKDGTTGYSSGTWSAGNLMSINRLQRFDGLHLVPVTQVAGTLNKMDANASALDLDLSAATAQTTFSGTDVGLSPSANPVALFSKVVQYSPSGSANVVTSLTGSPTVPPYIQVAFVPTHGAVAAAAVSNCAGLQVDGLTGAVSSFQPGQQ